MSQGHHSTPSAVLVEGPRTCSEPHPPSGIPPPIQPLLPPGVSPTQGVSPSFAGQFSPFRPPSMITPINTDKLESELLGHPDRSVADYVLTGLCHGFCLGFNPSVVFLRSASQNKSSALLQPEVIDNYLLAKMDKCRIAGPFPTPPLTNLHISHFGVIPKKHQPGKWCLILNLSSPPGGSVNDGIKRELFTVQYMCVDDAIDGIMDFGHGALMAKFDIENAYRIVPVYPEDRFLLGMCWKDNFFIDLALRFGLHSPPFIFTTIADLLEWILRQNYNIGLIKHYLDDFHTVGPPNSSQCSINLAP